jgi:hypothetical protein
MSKVKIFCLITVTSVVTVGVLAFLFNPGKVAVEPVTRSQVDAAYALLRDSLDNPRYTYIDFLNDNSPAVKPKNEITIIGGGGGGYLKKKKLLQTLKKNLKKALIIFRGIITG